MRGIKKSGSRSRPRTGREPRWEFATAVALVVAAGFAFLHFRPAPPPPSPQTLRYTLSGPADGAMVPAIAISPDGKLLAMSAIVIGTRQLWLRALAGLETNPIPFTEGASNHFWSPDGRFLGFFTSDNKLSKVAIAGTRAQTVCDAPGTFTRSSASWSRDNFIIFSDASTGDIVRVSAMGGVPVAVTWTKAHRRLPTFLPDGRRFLWLNSSGPLKERGIFVSSLDGKEERRVLAGDFTSLRLAPGERRSHVMFLRDDTLMALPLDAASATATGEAFPVAENIRGSSTTTASANEVLIYATVVDEVGQISWFDRSGKLLGPVSTSGPVAHPALSPDEKQVIFRRGGRFRGEIWLADLSRGTKTRLSSGEYDNGFPIWSPEGDRIVFGSDRDGHTQLCLRTANGSGQDGLLRPTHVQHTPSQWSRNGEFIVYSQRDSPETLWVLPMKSGAEQRTPMPFLQAETNTMLG